MKPDGVAPFACSSEEIAQLAKLARSTTAGIWRIKRAKVLLGVLEGRSPEELMYQVRVPVVSIIKCIRLFTRQRMAYFDKPARRPTAREALVENMLAFLDKPPRPSSALWKKLTLRYIGTVFTARDLRTIHDMIKAEPDAPRTVIAQKMCANLNLYGANGKPRLAIAKDILGRMAMDNIVSFSPSRPAVRSKAKPPPLLIGPTPETQEMTSLQSIPLRLSLIHRGEEALLWNAMIYHYHYISRYRLFGPQLRYLVYAENGRSPRSLRLPGTPLAALSFSPSAWRVSCRDDYIGWDDRQRRANLPLVVNNSRFLILPWIKVPNLASHILGVIARRAPHDWEMRYGRRPVLLETFVEKDRFRGTCYKAANWTEVGTTVGYSLHGQEQRKRQTVKAVFLQPLHRRFRDALCRTFP